MMNMIFMAAEGNVKECEHIPDGISYAAPLKYKCKNCGQRYKIVGD